MVTFWWKMVDFVDLLWCLSFPWTCTASCFYTFHICMLTRNLEQQENHRKDLMPSGYDTIHVQYMCILISYYLKNYHLLFCFVFLTPTHLLCPAAMWWQETNKQMGWSQCELSNSCEYPCHNVKLENDETNTLNILHSYIKHMSKGVGKHTRIYFKLSPDYLKHFTPLVIFLY